MTIIAIISIIAIIIVVAEFATFVVYGTFVSKQITETLMDLDEKKLSLNMFDPSILLIDIHSSLYIDKVPFSAFSKYNISNLGTVPRWSKLHKRINEYYAIAIKNEQKR